MKKAVKVGLFLLGIGWTLYWLVSKAYAPAASLLARHRAKREQLAEFDADRDGDA